MNHNIHTAGSFFAIINRQVVLWKITANSQVQNDIRMEGGKALVPLILFAILPVTYKVLSTYHLIELASHL